jgi:hypothetical protein
MPRGSQKLGTGHEGGLLACCEDHSTCKRCAGTVHLSVSTRQIPLCVYLQSDTILARITQHARKFEIASGGCGRMLRRRRTEAER